MREAGDRSCRRCDRPGQEGRLCQGKAAQQAADAGLQDQEGYFGYILDIDVIINHSGCVFL